MANRDDGRRVDTVASTHPDRIPILFRLFRVVLRGSREIANELAGAGREVYMSVGRHRAYPRTYRGRDIGEWMYIFGLFDDYVTSDVDYLHGDGRTRVPGLPVIGVKDGAAELNVGTLADKGVTLVGSVRAAGGVELLLEDNVIEIAEYASRSFRGVVDRIDTGLRQRGFVAPEQVPRLIST